MINLFWKFNCGYVECYAKYFIYLKSTFINWLEISVELKFISIKKQKVKSLWCVQLLVQKCDVFFYCKEEKKNNDVETKSMPILSNALFAV